mgnify:CR=1 FL=1
MVKFKKQEAARQKKTRSQKRLDFKTSDPNYPDIVPVSDVMNAKTNVKKLEILKNMFTDSERYSKELDLKRNTKWDMPEDYDYFTKSVIVGLCADFLDWRAADEDLAKLGDITEQDPEYQQYKRILEGRITFLKMKSDLFFSIY